MGYVAHFFICDVTYGDGQAKEQIAVNSEILSCACVYCYA